MKNRRIANLPVGMMQHMQRSMLSITFLLFLLFLLPAILYGEEPLKKLADIKTGVTWQTELPPEQGMQSDDGMRAMLEALMQGEQKDPPPWLEPLINAVMYLVVGFAVFAILYLLYQALRQMMQSFAQGENSDEVILLDSSGNDRYGVLKRQARQRGQQSVNRRIRKEYKKTILKHYRTAPAGSETPQELEEHTGMDREDPRAFHEIYEKARYSDQMCTGTELEQFRNARKEKHH